MRTPRSIRKAMLAVLGLALFALSVPAFADDDPPDRVARLSFLRGDVSFQPSGEDDWVQANLNRPLGTGDKLYTDRDSRVEMEVGAATLRLDAGTSFDILNLDDNIAQTELSEGTMNLHVRRVFEGQSYEVDTPTLAFVITQPGDYRVDIAPDGSSTMVTVFRGSGDVYGENNASYSVAAGNSYRFHDSSLQDYEVLDLPRGDEFDGWVDSRNNRYEQSRSRQYVSEEVIGYADLDDYGGWNDTPEYGHVWYPSQVETGWAPYRYGHWSWIDPWGWTWVDNASWGFAPFHYGRWVYVSNRWGWCPGPVAVRPVYAPALVAFVGGAGWGVSVSTGPVGWFPLGPRDVYVPWYHTSRNYFTNVNVRNTTVINNTYITNVYNNYSAGRPITGVNYAYRQNVNAVTAVPRDAFVGARAVNASRVRINENQLRNANVVSRVGITPQRASFVGAAPAARVQPQRAVQTRNVIARTQPPARPVPVANRIETIQRNNGQPLQQNQLRRAAPAVAAGAAAAGAAAVANRSQPQHVQVVGQNARKPEPLPARAPGAGAAQAGRTQPNRPGATPPGANAPNRTSPQTTPARGQANTPERATPNTPNRTAPATREQPANQGMPSSRFAPHGNQPARTTGETPQRSTGNAPQRSTGNAPERSTGNAPQRSTGNAPERSTGNAPQRSTGNAPSRTTGSTPERNAPATRNAPSSSSQPNRTTQPATRAPAERTAPTQSRTPPTRTQSEPQQRSAPAQSRTPPQQQQRSSPPPQQQRSAPPPQREYTPRTAPSQPQRSAPPPQQQQRSAPPPQQQRSAPPQQQRAQPAERRPPPERKKDDKDDNGHRRP